MVFGWCLSGVRIVLDVRRCWDVLEWCYVVLGGVRLCKVVLGSVRVVL